jgi:hypothetical protein
MASWVQEPLLSRNAAPTGGIIGMTQLRWPGPGGSNGTEQGDDPPR